MLPRSDHVPKRLSATIVDQRCAAQYGQYSAPMYKISGTVLPALFCSVSGGWPLIWIGAFTCTAWEGTPTVLKTDMGTLVIWATVVASVATHVVLPGVVGDPLKTLMSTSAATMTTTSPMASQVNRPAGRPLEALAGGRVFGRAGGRLAAWVAGRLDATFFFDAGDLATVLLGALRTTNLVDRTLASAAGVVLSSFHYGRNFVASSGRDRHHRS